MQSMHGLTGASTLKAHLGYVCGQEDERMPCSAQMQVMATSGGHVQCAAEFC